MTFRKIFSFLLLGIVAFHTATFSQGDEETIRNLLENITGQTSFSLNISRIKEGLTNRNFKVLYNGNLLFIRLGHKDPESLKINRNKELLLYSLAEKDGIAPKLIYSDATTGTLIVTFIKGTPYGKKGGRWLYERNESLEKIVTLLQRCHAHQSPTLQKIEYPFFIIDEYIQQARSGKISLPTDIDRAIDIVQNLKTHIPQHNTVLCHQDLVPDNFIFDGKKLYLVDWEYADWGDSFYDLAALCIEHHFDEEEKNLLLKAYFQTPTEEQRLHLEMMCMLYSLRDALWFFIENDPSSAKSNTFLEQAIYHYHNFFESAQWLQAHNITL